MLGKWQQRRHGNAQSGRRWLIAVAVSLVVQIPLLAVILYIIEHSVSDLEFSAIGVDTVGVMEPDPLEPIPAREWESIIQEPEEEKEEPDEIEGTEHLVGQFVEVVPVDKEEMPDKARFSSRYAMKVKKEVRARRPSKSQKKPRKYDKTTQREKRPLSRKGNPDAPDGRPAEKLGSAAQEKGAGAIKEGGQPSKGFPLTVPDGLAMMPPNLAGVDPFDKYSPSVAPFASDDYIRGVEDEGETNLLNTMPFRYAGFFERVKRAVRQHWDPNRVWRLRDPSGELYGHRDRFTALNIVLDSDGHIVDASITGQSGLKFLDDEAVRSFWAAGPFINPPSGLVKDDGRIRFTFTFGFLLASSRRSFDWRLQ